MGLGPAGTFANHGLVPSPVIIRRVEDQDGRVLYRAQESSTRAISDATAFLMSTMLADVVDAGTAAGARTLGFTLPAAGKTGTTNDFNDAWFVGFTPGLVAGVWVGFDRPHTIVANGFAADIAVPMWATFMKVATRGDAPVWFAPPPGVTSAPVCRLSGKLATGGCQDAEVVNLSGHVDHRSMIYTEYFARGTEPTTYCDVNPTRSLLGKLTEVFVAADRPAPPRIEDTGLVSVPTVVGLIELPPTPLAEPKKKRGFWSKIFRFGRNHPETSEKP